MDTKEITSFSQGSSNRLKLEYNWSQYRFKNFQFPHPDHLEESYSADVYSLHAAGSSLVSCSKDRSVRIWDISTQRLVLPPLLGHEGSVLCAQVDQENDLLYTCGTDTTIIVWKFSTGTIVAKVLEAHSESILSIAINDQLIVTGSKDKTIKIWYRSSLQGSRQLIGHSTAVNAVLVTKTRIVSGSGDGSIRIWDIETGGCLQVITHGRGITSLQLSADDATIYAASTDKTVRVFDFHGFEHACLRGHTNMVRRIQLSESVQLLDSASETMPGKSLVKARIVSAAYDGTLGIWQQNMKDQWHLTHRLNSDGTIFQDATGSSDGDGTASRAYSLYFDERRLICSSNTGTIMGWDFDVL
jgi:WD40 repeat protein